MASLTKVHLPNLSCPCLVILLLIECDAMFIHPPGLNDEEKGRLLFVAVIHGLLICCLMTLCRLYRILGWSVDKLCSVKHMMLALMWFI